MEVLGLERSREFVLAALGDHEPKSQRQIVKITGLPEGSAYNCFYICWKRGLILRIKEPIYEYERWFKGRAGISQTTRPYHLYLLRPEGKDSVRVRTRMFRNSC